MDLNVDQANDIWSNACIPYVLDPSLSERLKTKIEEALDLFRDIRTSKLCSTKVLSIRKATNFDSNRVIFKQDDQKCLQKRIDGFSNHIGMSGDNQIILNSNSTLGTITHEFMHLLGFRHAHNVMDCSQNIFKTDLITANALSLPRFDSISSTYYAKQITNSIDSPFEPSISGKLSPRDIEAIIYVYFYKGRICTAEAFSKTEAFVQLACECESCGIVCKFCSSSCLARKHEISQVKKIKCHCGQKIEREKFLGSIEDFPLKSSTLITKGILSNRNSKNLEADLQNFIISPRKTKHVTMSNTVSTYEYSPRSSMRDREPSFSPRRSPRAKGYNHEQLVQNHNIKRLNIPDKFEDSFRSREISPVSKSILSSPKGYSYYLHGNNSKFRDRTGLFRRESGVSEVDDFYYSKKPW